MAVVGCWASAWRPRGAAYRAAQGLVGDVDHVVVVQRQVDAGRAGVAFNADPVTGRRDRVRINGAWSLGEAVVDGAVTRDEWLVEPDSGQVVERAIADKAAWTVPTEEGAATPPPVCSVSSLTVNSAALLTRKFRGTQRLDDSCDRGASDSGVGDVDLHAARGALPSAVIRAAASCPRSLCSRMPAAAPSSAPPRRSTGSPTGSPCWVSSGSGRPSR